MKLLGKPARLNLKKGDLYLDAEISTDSSGCGISRIGLAKHHTSSFDNIQSLPNHGNDRAAAHVLDQTREEGPGSQICIMLLKVILRSLNIGLISYKAS